MMSLKMHVEKKLDTFTLKVDLEIEEGITGILGYSGSGKTMTLKMIAGIVTPDSGTIILNGKVLFDSSRKINLKSRERNIGLMFQSYALFNHMSVYDNIAIGMKGTKESKKSKINELLKMLELEMLEDKKPNKLSGGQKQRVALARILAQEPDLLMLDEPFSALDSHLQWTIAEDFKKALEMFKGSVLYISHNRQEIYKYCNQIAIMSDGCIVEYGKKEYIFDRCHSVAGARLTGCRNVAPLYKVSDSHAIVEPWDLELNQDVKEAKWVGIRQVDLKIVSTDNEEGLLAEVGEQIIMPEQVEVILHLKDSKLIYTCSKREYLEVESIIKLGKVKVFIDPTKLLLLQ